MTTFSSPGDAIWAFNVSTWCLQGQETAEAEGEPKTGTGFRTDFMEPESNQNPGILSTELHNFTGGKHGKLV